MVLVIIVALIGSDVTPEYVNFRSQERNKSSRISTKLKNCLYNYIEYIISNRLLNYDEQKMHTCSKANATETAPLISPAHEMIT